MKCGGSLVSRQQIIQIITARCSWLPPTWGTLLKRLMHNLCYLSPLGVPLGCNTYSPALQCCIRIFPPLPQRARGAILTKVPFSIVLAYSPRHISVDGIFSAHFFARPFPRGGIRAVTFRAWNYPRSTFSREEFSAQHPFGAYVVLL